MAPRSWFRPFFSVAMFARIFIPKKHRQRFDEAVSQSLINRVCRSKSLGDPQNRLRRSRSQDHHERSQGSKRASSVPRDTGDDPAQPERGLRKSTTMIPSHYVTGANHRYVSSTSFIGVPFPCPIIYDKISFLIFHTGLKGQFYPKTRQ